MSHKETILSAGLAHVHQHGFGASSVRDIVNAAGVPQGSFTNHFASKEAFGIEILELYFNNTRKIIAATLMNDDLQPLQRLKGYIDANRSFLGEKEMRTGCLLGNFTAEVIDFIEAIREKLVEIFTEIRIALKYCLDAAVKTKAINPKADTDSIAGLIVSSFQGAILLSKAQRNTKPVDHFEELLFSTILK